MKPGIYQHYKGNYYQTIGIARHEANLKEVVVYQELYGNYGLWTREIESFNETIDYNNESVPRFKFIKESMFKAPIVEAEKD